MLNVAVCRLSTVANYSTQDKGMIFVGVRKLKCIAYTNVLSPGNYLSSKDHVEFTQLERVNVYSPIGSGLRRRAQF